MRGLLPILLVAGAMMATTPVAAQVLEFESLPGWEDDDQLAALKTFLNTCDLMTDADWTPICKVAAQATASPAAARSFFEMFFKPVLLGTPPAPPPVTLWPTPTLFRS